MLQRVRKWIAPPAEQRRPEPVTPGYCAADLVDVVFAKTIAIDDEKLREMPTHAGTDQTVLAVAYAATMTPARPLRVLDFGGACGLHFRVARAAAPHLAVRWAIVETPMMVARASELNSDSLRFFAEIDDAHHWLGDVDLIYSSGAVQYVDQPEITLARLLQLKATVLCWARLALSDGERRRVSQRSMLSDNGPGPMPAQFADREVLYDLIEMRSCDFLAAHRDYRMMWKFLGNAIGYLYVR